MSDMWGHAAKSFREAMLDWTRRHRPDYAIIARTAWDEEWDERCATGRDWEIAPASSAICFIEVLAFVRNLSRDPRFLEAGKR